MIPSDFYGSSHAMVRLMDIVIGPSIEPYVSYYLDDIIICTLTFELQLAVLGELFHRLKNNYSTVNFEIVNSVGLHSNSWVL